MQLELQEEAEAIDPVSLVSAVNLEEARYLLQHFISLSITKVCFKPSKKLVIFIGTAVQTFEPSHVKRVLITYATSEGSGKPAHPRSLARAFAIHSHNIGK